MHELFAPEKLNAHVETTGWRASTRSVAKGDAL
jgi:hypothetical protein